MRNGYTTGSCAAAAAAAAAECLLTGQVRRQISLRLPQGGTLILPVEQCTCTGRTASACVRKDSGDDPDVTDGVLVWADVSICAENGIFIDGGEGIGRVTKPGLDQPVGAAAINAVPRRQICEAAEKACAACGYPGGVRIVISAPVGEEIAKKTFNPRLGIVGGISILGSSGVVEPMSERAIVETTALEIRQAAADGNKRLILLPGNYGMDYLTQNLPALSAVPRAKCSNYIGDAVDAARLEGFEEVILIGHIGKLVKLAGGIMNTHSKTADCRRELFVCHAALCGAGADTCRALMNEVTTDGCLNVLDRAGLRDTVMDSLLRAIQEHLARRAGDMRIGALLFSSEAGLLGLTDTARELLDEWRDGP